MSLVDTIDCEPSSAQFRAQACSGTTAGSALLFAAASGATALIGSGTWFMAIKWALPGTGTAFDVLVMSTMFLLSFGVLCGLRNAR